VKKWTFALLGATLLYAGVGASTAHAQLSRADQLFLYFNYYQNQRNTVQLQRQQDRQQLALNQLGQQQQTFVRNFAPAPTYGERYSRGRNSPQLQATPLPPIYSGQRSRQGFFLQTGGYFGPTR
jgi:hypothetical protein